MKMKNGTTPTMITTTIRAYWSLLVLLAFLCTAVIASVSLTNRTAGGHRNGDDNIWTMDTVFRNGIPVSSSQSLHWASNDVWKFEYQMSDSHRQTYHAGRRSEKQRSLRRSQPSRRRRRIKGNKHNDKDTSSSPKQRQEHEKRPHRNDFHFPAEPMRDTDQDQDHQQHRIVVTCPKDLTQDRCIENLLSYNVINTENDNGDRSQSPSNSRQDSYSSSSQSSESSPQHIRIIHNLELIHSVSILIDTVTRDALFADHIMELHRDFERRPLSEVDTTISKTTRNELHSTAERMAYERRDDEEERHDDGPDENNVNNEITWGLRSIRVPQVWDRYSNSNVNGRGGGAKICIIDTGVNDFHEDLFTTKISGYNGQEAVTPWWDDRKGHGTHICGTIAAAENGYGVIGIAPDVEVFVVRVFDEFGQFHLSSDSIYSSDLIAAAQICRDNGANIISASLGGPTYNRQEEQFFTRLFDDGIITVAAAGNTGDSTMIYPAAYEKVLSVGASNSSKHLSTFSTMNAHTDILAPGEDIKSTVKSTEYQTFTGTSFSAPHVSGTLALLITESPNARPQELFDAITNTATVPNDTQGTNRLRYGSNVGVLDAMAAIQCLVGDGPCEKETNSRTEQLTLADPHPCPFEVHLDLVTDSKGGETAYRLIRQRDSEVIWITYPNTLQSDETYSVTTCLEDIESECYQFDIRDTGNDGINGFGIDLFFRGHELYRGGNFGRGGSLTFGDAC